MIVTLVTEEDGTETCRQNMELHPSDTSVPNRPTDPVGTVLLVHQGNEFMSWRNKTVLRKYTYIKGENQ